MVDEKLQFAISQYVDGSLPPEEAAALESRMADNPEARALLDEYRRLDGLIRSETTTPDVDWDAMARSISAAVDSGAQSIVLPSSESGAAAGWWRPMALAAGLLICASAAIVAWKWNWHPGRDTDGQLAQGGSVAVEPRRDGPGKGTGEDRSVAQAPRPVGYAIVSVFRPDAPPKEGDVQVEIGDGARPGRSATMVDAYPDITAREQSRVLIFGLRSAMATDDELGLLQ